MNVIKTRMSTTLRIECNLTIEKAQFSIPPIGDYEALELCDDLQHLLTNSIMSDFTILCRNEVIPCHKAILVSRSSVFRRMLENIRTSTENKIEIIDCEPETMKDFLQFLYTGQVKDENFDQASYNSTNLLLLADKYNVIGLKKKCELTLANKMHVNNAIKVLTIASRCQFHQHFTRNFFIQKVFCAAFLQLQFGFVIIGERILAKKRLVKCR